MKKNLVKIRFMYNGDLGILQQRTKSNLEFNRSLAVEEVITTEEFDSNRKEILNYFQEEVRKVVDNPFYFVN